MECDWTLSNYVCIFTAQIGDSLMAKRLFRSVTNKKIAGICGGIAEMMDVDPTIIRLVTIVIALVTGIIPFIIAYIIAWWIVPEQPRSAV